jgi:hypothetical protein
MHRRNLMDDEDLDTLRTLLRRMGCRQVAAYDLNNASSGPARSHVSLSGQKGFDFKADLYELADAKENVVGYEVVWRTSDGIQWHERCDNIRQIAKCILVQALDEFCGCCEGL